MYGLKEHEEVAARDDEMNPDGEHAAEALAFTREWVIIDWMFRTFERELEIVLIEYSTGRRWFKHKLFNCN